MRIRRYIRTAVLVASVTCTCLAIAGTVYSYWYSCVLLRISEVTSSARSPRTPRSATIARVTLADGGLFLSYEEFSAPKPVVYATDPLARRRRPATGPVSRASASNGARSADRSTGMAGSTNAEIRGFPPPLPPDLSAKNPTPVVKWHWERRELSGRPFRQRPPNTVAGATSWRFAGFSFTRFRAINSTTGAEVPLWSVVCVALGPGVFLIVRRARRARRGFEVSESTTTAARRS